MLDAFELDEIRQQWNMLTIRQFKDGTVAGVFRLMFTHAIVSEVDGLLYGRRWCYRTRQEALAAFDDWENPLEEPDGFVKAVHTGERRNEKNETVGYWY